MNSMRDPFKIDGPTCISFSGGRTSAYMLWRVLQSNGGLPTEAKVCFANTGKEEEATLRFVRDCGKQWGVDITWLEYINQKEHDSASDVYADELCFIAGQEQPKRGSQLWVACDFESAARNGEPYEAVIAQRGGYLPNRVARYCSSELKTRTMHRYLRWCGWTEWETFIGIRADEPRRVAKFKENTRPETKSEVVYMPLAQVGISASDVGKFWNEQSFDLELPNNGGKTMHGNCDLCFLKPVSQVQSLISEKPERAIWWAKQEIKAKAAGIGFSGARFRDDRPSYADMKLMAEKQVSLVGFEHEESQSCYCGE